MSKPKVYHNPLLDVPNEIETFLHCQKCLKEKPDGIAPRDWARLSVGLTKRGTIQVWCVRHDCNVDHMAFKPFEGLEYPK